MSPRNGVAVVALLVAALSQFTEAELVVVSPKVLTAGQRHSVFVTGAESPVEVQLADSDGVVAKAVPQQANAHMHDLVVPATLTPSDDGSSYVVWARNSDGTIASKVSVTVAAESEIVIIEQDKALYKPGQTAQFRALALSPSKLRPLGGRRIQFEVASPKGFKLLQESGETDGAGVARFEMPIASEPLLGTHKARATLVDGRGEGAVHEVPFEIAEYVLPKFEVTLKTNERFVAANAEGCERPSGFRRQTVDVTGTVEGRYTHGEAVRGQVTVVVRRKMVAQPIWNPVPDCLCALDGGGGCREPKGDDTDSLRKIASATVQLQGERADYTVSVPLLSLPRGDGELLLEATLADDATGEVQRSESVLHVRGEGQGITFEVKAASGFDYFKPGLPFKAIVEARHPDGAPATSQDLAGLEYRLRVQQGHVYLEAGEVITWLPLAGSAFSDDGTFLAEVLVPPDNEECCDPLANAATYDEHIKKHGCCAQSMKLQVFLPKDGDAGDRAAGSSEQLCLSRAYTTSGYFLEPSLDDQGAVAVTTTLPLAEEHAVEYMWLQGASVVDGGTVKPTEVTCSGSLCHATLPGLAVPESAVGQCRFVAVIRLQDSSVVTGSLRATRDFRQPFSLDVSFEPEEVKPAGAVAIQLNHGAANGPVHAFIASVDRSVELLGRRAAIDAGAILQSIARVAPPAAEVAGKAWRECHLHGGLVPIVGELNGGISVLASPDSAGQAPPNNEGGGSQADDPYGEPLGAKCPRPLSQGCWGGRLVIGAPEMNDGAGLGIVDVAAPDAGSGGIVADAASYAGSGGDAAAPAVRSFFPETWLWQDMALPGAGEGASISATAPDTITEWSLEAFATSPDGVATKRSEVPLRVFKPVFVEMRLPYSAVRSEKLDISIGAFNFLESPAEVKATLTIELPPQLALTAGRLSQSFSIPREGSKRTTITVEASAVGSFPIKATLETYDGPSDAMMRHLLVKAEGVEKEVTQTVIVDVDAETASQEATLSLPLPGDAVSDSAHFKVSAVGDLMGPSLKGLDKLLRIPTGCGEQNMITLAPNVYAGKYLTSVGRLGPELRRKITRNLVIGYGRELTYRHDDGSFSAFGTQDPSGSTWLTAFVLRVFAEIHELGLVAVDSGVLESAASWLVGHQEKSGAFASVGSVIHQEMVGGLGGSGAHEKPTEELSEVKRASITAYVLVALAKVKDILPDSETVPANVLQKAKSFLQGVDASAGGKAETYADVLRTYSLLLAGTTSGDVAGKRIMELATETSNGQLFWEAASGPCSGKNEGEECFVCAPGASRCTETGDKKTCQAGECKPEKVEDDLAFGMWYSPPVCTSIDVELTGYGLLTLVAAGRITDALKAARWLMERRSASGGFQSTQDTVVALGALAAFSAEVAGSVDLQVALSGAGLSETWSIAASNFDVMQTKVANPGERVKVTAAGTGVALVIGALRYNVLPKPREQEAYSTTTRWIADSGAVTGVRVCSTPRNELVREGGTGMVIFEVEIFTGFAADVASCNSLLSRGLIKRFEIEDRTLALYIDELDVARETCLDVGVKREFQASGLVPVSTSVYEYYAPDRQGVSMSAFPLKEFASSAVVVDDDEVTEGPTVAPSFVPSAAPTSAPNSGGGTPSPTEAPTGAAQATNFAAAAGLSPTCIGVLALAGALHKLEPF